MISWKDALKRHKFTNTQSCRHNCDIIVIHKCDNQAIEAAENSLNQLALDVSSFFVTENSNLIPESRDF